MGSWRGDSFSHEASEGAPSMHGSPEVNFTSCTEASTRLDIDCSPSIADSWQLSLLVVPEPSSVVGLLVSFGGSSRLRIAGRK
jgi:hypothetical protein